MCGGLGNFTVTQAIELVYPDAANGTGTGGGVTGGVGGSGSGAGDVGSLLAKVAPVLFVVAAILLAGVLVWVRRKSPGRRQPPARPG